MKILLIVGCVFATIGLMGCDLLVTDEPISESAVSIKVADKYVAGRGMFAHRSRIIFQYENAKYEIDVYDEDYPKINIGSFYEVTLITFKSGVKRFKSYSLKTE